MQDTPHPAEPEHDGTFPSADASAPAADDSPPAAPEPAAPTPREAARDDASAADADAAPANGDPAAVDDQVVAPQATAAAAAAPPVAELSPTACAAQLGARFPALFGPGVALPLKLRIQADIQQRAPGIFTRKALSIFLHRHTTSNAYLKALARATQRFDLDGAPAGELADEHRQAAVAELERRRGVHLQRREAQVAAERDARRESAETEGRARAERAALLRAHEASTLTRKNFCALKGVAEDALDALLALARQERAATLQRQPTAAPPADGPRRNAPRRPGPASRA
ncbi:MAG: ProQ/FinO family protein [Piscinibacter sp.]|nr:ProQ/FinO family protein [Piscinibacter sp.]